MERLKDSKAKGIDWLIAGALGALAAVVYFISMADYAFPGDRKSVV